jgi:ATP-binding cassette, subfamily B, bacterial
VTWLVVRTQLRRENLELWKVLGYQTSANRRSEYYRDLAFTQQAAKEIRVFGLGGWLRDGFEAHWRSAMSAVWTARRSRRAPLVALFGVVVAVNVVVVVLVVRAAESGHLGIAGLTLALQGVVGAAVMGSGGADDVLVDWGAATIPALARLERALAPLLPRAGPAGQALVEPPPWDGLRLEKVAFRYPGQVAGTLGSVDLELQPGRSLALVGANGAGKTTIVKLICRLIEPGSGTVLLGGVDLARVDPVAWRRQVAVVFQDFVHYPASVEDNVCFGAVHGARDQRVLEEVAELAGVDRFVAGLSHGWATELSREVTAGTELSGGQWQSVALARALYALRSGAKILILDEPTANLDARAEAVFYDRFLDITRGVTTILVSHRFSTVRKADEICVLEGGRVTERGPHHQLLAAGGQYATMFALQAEAYRDAVEG